ncbi:MAG: hypothetical protein WC553_01835 [Patescibacteria group bacterium]
MKQRKFIHRLVDMVEHELEATLAILIVLASIVGYTLASTETATNDPLTAQQSSGTLAIGNGSYSTLSFDRTYTSGSTYQVRLLKIEPSDAASVSGQGLTGTRAGQYTATISLKQAFTGKLYVYGTYSSISLNGTTVTSPTSPVTVLDAESLILSFAGIQDKIRAISVNAGIATDSKIQEVANLSLIPSLATTVVGTPRTFIVIATDASGLSVPSNQLDIVWSVKTTPSNIATINSNGVVTPTGAGTIIVTAKAEDKTASSTITVVEPVQEVTQPITTDTTTSNSTESESNITTGTEETDRSLFRHIPPLSAETPQSILDTIAEVLAPAAEAATEGQETTGTAIATKTADALYSLAVVAERVATTNSVNPSNAEIKAVSKTMTLAQKAVFNLKSAANQINQDLRAIAVGTKIVDANGKVIVEQPNAVNLFAQKIKSLFSGVGASPMRGAVVGDDVIN